MSRLEGDATVGKTGEKIEYRTSNTEHRILKFKDLWRSPLEGGTRRVGGVILLRGSRQKADLHAGRDEGGVLFNPVGMKCL